MSAALGKYGLALDGINVPGVSLPEELQAALDERISFGMAGDLNDYTQYQTANAIPLAAQNEGGIAGIGAGRASTNAVTGQQEVGIGMTPATPADPAACLEKLKGLLGLLDKSLISRAESDDAKVEVLKRLVG